MNHLETGKDKIQKICEILKNETLLPAKEEAEQVILNAQEEARQIVRDAEKKAEEVLQEARQKIEKERALFEGSMIQACRQALESLRQEIENQLFNPELSHWVETISSDPKLGAKLISVLVQAVEKEGTSADFSAMIPTQVSKEQVNALLTRDILDKLRAKSVTAGDFAGGVQLKLHDRKLTLDLSGEAIKELLSKYIRKDFRTLLFQA